MMRQDRFTKGAQEVLAEIQQLVREPDPVARAFQPERRGWKASPTPVDWAAIQKHRKCQTNSMR